MPTQEVARVASTALLQRGARRPPGSLLLDGGGPDSWGDGRVVYTHAPRRTLEIYPSGWGRWSCDGVVQWRNAPPFRQWQYFLESAADALPAGGDRDAAGVLTVLSYDLKHWIERLPRHHSWPGGPILYSALYDWHYVANHRSGRALLRAQSPGDLEHYASWCAAEPAERSPAPLTSPVPCPQHRMRKADYLAMVERAREYIAAGDIYQVNLAQSFSLTRPAIEAPALFSGWCGTYPAPYSCYVDAGAWTIVSNSPECFLRVDGRRVSTFPIKGTRRGTATGRDAEELARDPKERAEHVMIVDLERSDLGRVCEPGSVDVSGFAEIRAFPLLLHMVSEVAGTLRPDIGLPGLIRATFPGGSVTGAPKVRAMQIIEELEPVARGIYTGAIGWTDLDGNGSFSLPIRTAVVSGRGLTYHAGGAIVADSDPLREYEESLLKSEAFFRSLATMDGPL